MALAKLNVIIGADIDQLKSALSSAQKRIAEAGKSMEQFGKTLSKRVTAPIVAMGALSVRAFGQQEQAELRLRAALAANGREVDSLFSKYNSFAQEMQRTTVVGDETTLAMLAQAESLGITGEAAERAVRNSIAMQSAFGVNAQSALRYTAALEEGNATMLTRYLPALRDIEDESERAAAAQDMLSKAFASAEAEAQGTTGQIQQMRNALGDAMEDIGGIIAQAIMPFISRIKELAESFQNLDADVQRNIVIIAGFAAAVGPVLVIMGKLLQSITIVTTAVKGLYAVLALNPWVAVGAAVLAFAGYIAKITYESRKATRQIQEMLDLDPTGTDQEMQKIAASIAEVQSRIESARKRHEEYGVTGTEVAEKELRELEETRLALIRKLQAAQEVRDTISDEEPVNVVEDLNEQLEETEQTLKRISASEPLREIMAEDAVLLDLDLDLDLDVNTRPAEGSIAHYEAILRGINKQIRDTNDETWRHAQMVQRDSIQAQIDELYRMEQAGSSLFEIFADNMQSQTGRMVTAFATLSAESSKSFGEMARSFLRMARQMIAANLAISIAEVVADSFKKFGIGGLVVAPAAGAAAAALFNRIVPDVSVNDALITSRGDVVKFHPDDNILAMKDFSALGGAVTDLFSSIVPDFGDLGGAVTDLFNRVMPDFGDFGGAVADLFSSILPDFGDWGGGVTDLFSSILPDFGDLGGGVTDLFSRIVPDFGDLGGAVTDLFSRIMPDFSINAELITSSESMVTYHPDAISAMKDFSALGGGAGTVRIEPFVLPGGDILFSQERAGKNQTRTGRR